MTAVLREPAPVAAPTPASASVGTSRATLAGTGTLIRFILRRDRIKLPAWLLGSTLLLVQLITFVTGLAETAEQREDLTRFMDGATGALFGPGYGRFDVTVERYVVGTYGLFFFILAALMSLQLVTRHTRAEEQDDRTELIRSNAVGRHAPLAAVLTVVVGANAVLALLLGGTMAAQGFAFGDSLLFGAGVGVVGLVFAAIAALTTQITEYGRAANGMAGAALGVTWAVRAVGDLLDDYGSTLSWFSPLAWSNQTRPYVDGRWWPLLLSVGLAAAVAAAGFALSARRDVGAGMVAASTGRSNAAGWLRSSFTVAFRLQRASLLWWTVAMAAFGFTFGGVSQEIADPEDMSADRLEMLGGSLDTLLDGYLGLLTFMAVVISGIMVTLGVQAVRSEETSGRAEPVLATATGRRVWFGGYLTVLSAGLVTLLLVVGLTTGIGAAVSEGDSSYIWDVTAAHLVHAPGVLVLLGLAALLFGVLPRAINLTWAVVGYSLFVGLFGSLMDLPQWIRNLLPMEHIGQPPLDSVSWPVPVALTLVAIGLMAAGLVGFSRRDLETK